MATLMSSRRPQNPALPSEILTFGIASAIHVGFNPYLLAQKHISEPLRVGRELAVAEIQHTSVRP
jgi:hypothetical protein